LNSAQRAGFAGLLVRACSLSLGFLPSQRCKCCGLGWRQRRGRGISARRLVAAIQRHDDHRARDLKRGHTLRESGEPKTACASNFPEDARKAEPERTRSTFPLVIYGGSCGLLSL
jgi:hypothetical protein